MSEPAAAALIDSVNWFPPSEHDLGPYFVPAYKDDERFWKPDDCLKDDVYLRCVKELWEVVLGIRKDLPKWASYYSMRKYAVTTPNILNCEDPDRWKDRDYISLKTG
jgi:hypothetical protein